MTSLVLPLLDQVGEVALATVVPIRVHRHEDAWATELVRALASKSRNLVIAIDFVKLEHSELHFLALVLDLLGFGVRLLLSLFSTASKLQVEEHSGILLKTTSSKHL